ncbi:hypothetical protein LRP88_10896 [Fusarium phalaenopsidis]
MVVPQECTVLVIGGGPAGSYAACCLAREGIDTVVLEADKFPRYHIGESTLPSLRHFFKFIDFDDQFNAHGFFKKNGAVFRLAQGQPDAYIDFLAAGGPDGHAGACGAHIFDETKVDTVQFEQTASNVKANQPGRPVSATWTRKGGSSGSVSFKYLVDASGRRGILSTKYLQNRAFNPNFKNVANWGYWKGDKLYGVGTHMEGSPYFEGFEDASGWAWFMPLHDGTRSVGIVQDQKLATEKRQASGRPSTLDFYKKVLELAPKTKELLEGAELVSEIRSASDYSYTASTYHLPNARICGDAGCFIDPLFSSGVHLAITGGLSAAVTIMSSLRGDYDEEKAGSWHSKKTIESYTRFFLAVSSATKQIRTQHEPVLQDIDEEGFQRAFDLLRPIMQGTVDADSRKTLSQTEVSKVLEFRFRASVYVPPEKKDALFEKLKKLGVGAQGEATTAKELEDIKKHLTPEESQIVEILQSRRMIREDPFDIDSFTLDAIDGMAPNLEHGKLGLIKAKTARLDTSHFYSPPFLDGLAPEIRKESTRHAFAV